MTDPLLNEAYIQDDKRGLSGLEKTVLIKVIFGGLMLALLMGDPKGLSDFYERLLGKSGSQLVVLASSDLAGFCRRFVGEDASAWFLIAAIVFTIAGLFLNESGRNIRAMATVTFKESCRSGVLWVFIGLGAVIAIWAPFLEAAGGAPGRIKMIVTITAAMAATVGSVMAITVPALSFSREKETRSIYVTATKPISRTGIYLGKLLGISVALLVGLLAIGSGGVVAGAIALKGAAAESERRGEDPRYTWATGWYSRKPSNVSGEPVKSVRFYHGQPRSWEIPVKAESVKDGLIVLRIHARPAEPRIQSAPALIKCSGVERRINVDRVAPSDLVMPARIVSDGKVRVTVCPVLDTEGINRGLRTHPLGTVSVPSIGNGLIVTVLEMMLSVWFQLIFVASVVLTAAGIVSFPVATVAGVAATVTGHLSGLAVGIIRQALAIGRKFSGAESGLAVNGQTGLADEGGVSFLAQLVRQEAAGLLSMLPDFDGTSPGEYVSQGQYVPWSFLAAAVAGLILFRAVPVIVLGCWSFSRKELGA